ANGQHGRAPRTGAGPEHASRRGPAQAAGAATPVAAADTHAPAARSTAHGADQGGSALAAQVPIVAEVDGSGNSSLPVPADAPPPAAGRPHPRPRLRRDRWSALDGPWEFAFSDGQRHAPDDVELDRAIVVPFAPETPAGGIADEGFHPDCWYRRLFATP